MKKKPVYDFSENKYYKLIEEEGYVVTITTRHGLVISTAIPESKFKINITYRAGNISGNIPFLIRKSGYPPIEPISFLGEDDYWNKMLRIAYHLVLTNLVVASSWQTEENLEIDKKYRLENLLDVKAENLFLDVIE